MSLSRTCSLSAFNQSINPQRRQTPRKEEGQHDTHNQPPHIQPPHHQREEQAPKKRKPASTINNQRASTKSQRKRRVPAQSTIKWREFTQKERFKIHTTLNKEGLNVNFELPRMAGRIGSRAHEPHQLHGVVDRAY